MKKTLLVGFYYGLLSALCLGGALPARAQTQTTEPDFTQLERLTELRPCKRMEKEFKPILSEIEKERQKTGVGTRLLWVDLYNTGYCTALPVPLTDLGKLLLERFPKEIPFGFHAVNWNPVQQNVDRRLPYELDDLPVLDEIRSLITLYYDKKNKDIYWMEYSHGIYYNHGRNYNGSSAWKLDGRGGAKQYDFISGNILKNFLKIHYTNLLDDLALIEREKKRDWNLILQIQSIRSNLNHTYKESEFVASEDRRRGELMKVLEEKIPVATIPAWGEAVSRALKQAQDAKAYAPYKNTDFSQLERRVNEWNKSCKQQLEKEFQPVFEQIEKERREEGINAPSQVLWGVDSNGYCTAFSYPLGGDNAMILKQFPEVFPVGGRYVRWNPVKKKIESDTVVERMMVRNFIKEEVENPNIIALNTIYYDRKNKTTHWIEYRLHDTDGGDAYENFFDSSVPLDMPFAVPFLEHHYRTLLDDLAGTAETAEAEPRRNMLVSQIQLLQAYLRERFKDTAFLEAEHKRRGPLMRMVDSVNAIWPIPDCAKGDGGWPCPESE